MPRVRYETTMFRSGNNTGIPVPPEVVEELGVGKRAALRVTVNGYAYQGTLASMGGQFLLSFSSERRRESGIAGGDALTVELEPDTAPRVVEVPADLAAPLEEAGVRGAFDALAPSHRKAHVTAVEGAKAPATRARRVAAAVDALRGP
jgi:hypothetical protein